MKNKWTKLYTGLAAGTVVTGSLIAANKIAEKYGQKPNQDKLFNINLTSVIDYGIKKILAADDEKVQKIMGLFIKNDNVSVNTSADNKEITIDIDVNPTEDKA